jgi:cell division protein FtsI (penicillin-binding protein 3)
MKRAEKRYEIPRRRVTILLVGFLIFSLAITYRVVSFQVVRSEELSEQAIAFRYREDAVPARRGDILDSRGRPLATNVPADRVSAILKEIADPHQTALLLAPLIGRSASDIEAAITQPDKEFVVLQHKLSPEASQKVTDLKLKGIVLDPEPRRTYPMGDFLSQVLGFVNDDYVGSYGIEGYFDKVVGGTPGKLVGERDGLGNVIAIAKSTWEPPKDGADLELTINSAAQRIVEQALDEAVRDQDATGGTAIVEDVKTGEIIAMASRPSFDPNNFGKVDDAERFNNPAISLMYEPGSTFKTLTMALGLETGVVTPNTVHDGGAYKQIPGGQKVYNARQVDFGPETMTEVLKHSSNLGAMYVAEQVGQDRFYQGLKDFGIGQPTGIELAAEAGGILPVPDDANWTLANFYTSAFGQGLAVTPIQLVNTEAAIANGGKLMKAHIVKEIRDGQHVENTSPEVIRQVISPQTAKTLTDMLVQVADDTYAKRFRVPGYKIAAKTGTAQIPSPNGGYEENATIGSVLGYGPSPDPRFAVLVKIDRPKKSQWGEESAGPTFAKIFQQMLLLYGIPPTEPVDSPGNP